MSPLIVTWLIFPVSAAVHRSKKFLLIHEIQNICKIHEASE